MHIMCIVRIPECMINELWNNQINTVGQLDRLILDFWWYGGVYIHVLHQQDKQIAYEIYYMVPSL